MRITYPLSLDLPQIFDLCSLYADLPGTIFLASGSRHPSASVSFLGLFSTDDFSLTLPQKDPWDLLEKKLTFSYQDQYPEWVGYLSYEMGAYSDLEKEISHHPSFMPDICFYRPACWIRYDHRTKESLLILDSKSYSSLPSTYQEKIQQLIDGQFIFIPSAKLEPTYTINSTSDTFESYCAKILHIQEMIRSGIVYQVNLSQQLNLEGEGDPFDLYQRLYAYNPTPFSAYMQTGAGTVISLSPERLLAKQGSRLETRPIKGTAPRGKTPEEDEVNKRELENSLKDKAELMMITDLMRNDLSRVSVSGTVKVPLLRHFEGYANVFHTESVVVSEAEKDKSVFALLRACFPGGSITGCPKLSAMQAIYDIEQRPRGIYTGSIGYFCGNGDFDFNIAIRTLWHQKNFINLQLGGGIVIDSDPKKEYEETVHKGASLMKILQQARRIDGILRYGVCLK